MNQQQIKEHLLELEDVPDFTVILSGKKSGKVDGLYKPLSKEIIIHNRNMKGDNDTMYTAIHEFAHHVHCTKSGIPVSGRCHTREFWAILHRLLEKAEKKGIYRNVFRQEKEFAELTENIRENYILPNGKLMKELGSLLAKARKMCLERHLSFDDYADRELGIHRTAASTLINISRLDIAPEIGYDNMKTVASIREPEKRAEAEKSFINQASPDMVKASLAGAFSGEKEAFDPVKKLEAEKSRIIRTINTLEKKLAEIDSRLKDFEK